MDINIYEWVFIDDCWYLTPISDNVNNIFDELEYIAVIRSNIGSSKKKYGSNWLSYINVGHLISKSFPVTMKNQEECMMIFDLPDNISKCKLLAENQIKYSFKQKNKLFIR